MHPVATTGSRTFFHAPDHGFASGRRAGRRAFSPHRREYRDDPLLRENQDATRPARTKGGHRVYGPKETRILVFIRRGRQLGFTLDQIRALLNLAAPGKASCREVRAIAARHLEDVRAKIADLEKLET